MNSAYPSPSNPFLIISDQNHSYHSPASAPFRSQEWNIHHLDKNHFAHQKVLRDLINHESSQTPINFISSDRYSGSHNHLERRRNYSEIEENFLRFQKTKLFPFSTNQKIVHDEFRAFPDVSEFQVTDLNEKNKISYNSIIKPKNSQSRSMSFQERRRNFKIRDENEMMNNKAYLHKIKQSFVEEFNKNQNFIEKGPNSKILSDYFSENFINRIFERNHQVNFGENPNYNISIGKDCNPMNLNNQPIRATHEIRPPRKRNLANLPLLVQDFIVLIEYDQEISKAKRLLKENCEVKLSVLYRIMQKQDNSLIELRDFMLLVKYLRLDFKEENVIELFRRFSTSETLKLKFYDLMEMLGISSNEAPDSMEEQLSNNTKQIMANYLKLLLNREKEHKKFKLSISHNQNTLDLFRQLDQDKKGYLLQDDIRRFLNSYEILTNQTDLYSIMKIFNKSNSGRVNYSEFLNEINS